MVKVICYMSLLALFTAACHKNEISLQGSSLSLAIDGKTVNFKVISIDSNQAYLGIFAQVDTAPNAAQLSLYIYRNGPLTVGSYPVLTPTSGSSEIDYYERSAGVVTEYQSPDDVINISTASGIALAGNFTATCDLALIDLNTYIVTLDPTRVRRMTNGKFYISLK